MKETKKTYVILYYKKIHERQGMFLKMLLNSKNKEVILQETEKDIENIVEVIQIGKDKERCYTYSAQQIIEMLHKQVQELEQELENVLLPHNLHCPFVRERK